jgi:hypothetical protein
MATPSRKTLSEKKVEVKVCGDYRWTIVAGALTRQRGRPRKTSPLFKAVGEKIPFEFLTEIKDKLTSDRISTNGVYIAHDSMGYPRYIGRGSIFSRLEARRKAQFLELAYFSFFVVEEKAHEREIETIMIRAAGPLLDFNDRKVRNDIQAGDVRDFEAGTKYIERQYRKGKAKKEI